MWRADETDLVTAAPIKPGGILATDPRLPAAWWSTLESSLDALAAAKLRRPVKVIVPAVYDEPDAAHAETLAKADLANGSRRNCASRMRGFFAFFGGSDPDAFEGRDPSPTRTAVTTRSANFSPTSRRTAGCRRGAGVIGAGLSSCRARAVPPASRRDAVRSRSSRPAGDQARCSFRGRRRPPAPSRPA